MFRVQGTGEIVAETAAECFIPLWLGFTLLPVSSPVWNPTLITDPDHDAERPVLGSEQPAVITVLTTSEHVHSHLLVL